MNINPQMVCIFTDTFDLRSDTQHIKTCNTFPLGLIGIYVSNSTNLMIAVKDQEDGLIKRGYADYLINEAWICFENNEENKPYKIEISRLDGLPKEDITATYYLLQPFGNGEFECFFSLYNKTIYQIYNNCYTYAMGWYYNKNTEEIFPKHGVSPGELKGKEIDFTKSEEEIGQQIIQYTQEDLQDYGRTIMELSSDNKLRNNCYRVALFLSKELEDYHWYRQTENGIWSHKPGITKAVCIDNNLEVVIEPKDCDNYYDYFAGYYEVTNAFSEAKQTIQEKERITNVLKQYKRKSENEKELQMKVNKIVTEKEINQITKGMSIDTVYKILGEPHKTVGSGILDDVYIVSDTKKQYQFRYSLGEVKRIKIVEEKEE